MKFLEKGLKKKILIAALAYINSVSIAYYMAQGNQTSYYYGLTFFGWNPSCIAFFALAVILLLRFFNKEVLSNKKRVVASTILGALFSYTALWGTYMLYGTNSIFDSTPKIILGFLAPIGMMILIVPAFSECFGLVDRLRTEQCDKAPENAENIGNESVDSTQSVVLKGKRITSDFLYAVIMWIVFFLKFGVMFLLYWPVVLCYDASYQLSEYVNKSFSTHHPFLHTFLLGKCYDLGLKIGNLELGISVYTLIQMTVLSASFAFFMYFLRKFEKRKWVRVVTFVLFLNPVHGYFSQTTTKGTLCGAFTLLALTCFLFYLKERKKALNLVLFVAFSVLACQFRNNMIYAVVVAGIIIIICIKGLKKKA